MDECNIEKRINWPHNLYADIFGKTVDLPENWEVKVNEALDTLKEIEKGVILEKYEQGLYPSIIAAGYNVNSRVIYQVIDKALKKLRHKSRKVIMLYGLSDARARYNEPFLAEYHIRIKSKYGEESTEYKLALDASLYELTESGLSSRIINMLARNGITYLDELIPFDLKTIQNTRALGKKSIDELVNKMIALNIYFEDNTDIEDIVTEEQHGVFEK